MLCHRCGQPATVRVEIRVTIMGRPYSGGSANRCVEEHVQKDSKIVPVEETTSICPWSRRLPDGILDPGKSRSDSPWTEGAAWKME